MRAGLLILLSLNDWRRKHQLWLRQSSRVFWRERAPEKGFPASPMTISYLLNPEVQASEDVMSTSLLQSTMVLGSETQDPEGPRKAASNIKTREWLGGAQ